MALQVTNQELLATTIELVDKEFNKVFEQEASLMNEFEKVTPKRTNLKGLVLPAYLSPNVSIGYRDEGGSLPVGGTHKAKQWRVFFNRSAIARRMTGDAMDMSDEDSMINNYADGMSMDMETWRKDQNAELFGDGSGAKAFISVVSGATPTFADPRGCLLLQDNGQYQVYDPATWLPRTATIFGLNPGTIDKNAHQATFNSSVSGSGITAGDFMAYAGSGGNSITGLEKLVSDAADDLQGVSRATNPNTKSPNLNASNKALSLSLIDQQETLVGFRAGNLALKGRYVIVTNNCQVVAYRDTGRNYQQYQSGMKYDGGNGGLGNQTVNGRVIKTDVDCKTTDWWFLNLDSFGRAEFSKLQVMNKDGNAIHQIPINETFYDSYIYYIGAKYDIFVRRPQQNSRMYNLSVVGLPSPHFN